MQPDTRLLVRLTFANGDMRGWGYDYPHYPTADYLKQNLEEDFETLPEHTEIRLFYYEFETEIVASTGIELAEKAVEWLVSTGGCNTWL